MKTNNVRLSVSLAIVLAMLGGTALPAPDKYTVKVPDGLGLSEVRGYESWEVMSASHATAGESSELFNVIVANPTMIKAYAAGIPGNGKPFPDGAKAVKIQYVPKKSTEAPFNVVIPDELKDLAVMVKDTKRFPNSGG